VEIKVEVEDEALCMGGRVRYKCFSLLDKETYSVKEIIIF